VISDFLSEKQPVRLRHNCLSTHSRSTSLRLRKNGEMMDVAEGDGARRRKFSCSAREIFLHGADGGGARCFWAKSGSGVVCKKRGEKHPRKTLVFCHFACRSQKKFVPLHHEKHKERERAGIEKINN